MQNDVEKRVEQLKDLNRRLSSPHRKKRTREQLCREVTEILHGQFMDGLIKWHCSGGENQWQIQYDRDEEALAQLKKTLGIRVLMTDRHEWKSEEIIKAYHSQAWVEFGFKSVKSPITWACVRNITGRIRRSRYMSLLASLACCSSRCCIVEPVNAVTSKHLRYVFG